MQVMPWICSQVWTPGAEKTHNWSVPESREDKRRGRHTWAWSLEGTPSEGGVDGGFHICPFASELVWPWIRHGFPLGLYCYRSCTALKILKRLQRILLLSWRSRRVTWSSCVAGTLAPSIGISWSVEQPHGSLRIENGSSMVAENAGWLLRKVGH